MPMAMKTDLLQYLVRGRAAMIAPPVKPARDLRIDIVRGLALMIIFIDHMPGNVISGFTPHAYGFSDAAEMFVFLSGISAALAYGRVIDGQGIAAGAVKVFGRMRTLYVAHLAVFLVVVALVAVAVEKTSNPLYLETINITPVLADPLKALREVLALVYQPNYLDILPLYVLLLGAFPLVHLAVRLSPVATVIASIVLWRFAAATDLNLPNGSGGWMFNPFAWQVVFVVGVVIGYGMRVDTSLEAAPRRTLDIAAVAMVAFSAIVMLSPANPFAFLGQHIADLSLGTDKSNLEPVRFLHLLAVAWLFIRLVPADATFLKHPAATALARAGSHSLEVFCAGTVLSILGQVVLAETAYHVFVQLLVCAVGVSVLLTLGNILTWTRSLSKVDSPRAAGISAAPATGPVSRSPSSA